MNKWVLSANPNYFNHEEAFHQLGFIDWKQTRNFDVGDIVYIYVTKPVSAIRYKTVVTKVFIPENEIENFSRFWIKVPQKTPNSVRYVRLEMVEKYDDNQFSYANIRNHGMTYPPQSPWRVKPELQEYLDGCEVVSK